MGFIREFLESKKTILIVDDEILLMEAIAASLEKAGYKIFKASNGSEGVSLAIKKNPALVILDINMPEMNGWAVLATLRNTDGTKRTPVVMLTTINQLGDINKSFEMGATGYLTKPLDPAKLYRKIEEIIGKP